MTMLSLRYTTVVALPLLYLLVRIVSVGKYSDHNVIRGSKVTSD